MKTLKTEIKFQGRTLRQLKREGNVAIYDVRNAGNTLYGFEVIIVKVAPAETIMGREYPEREVYPSSRKESDDWGSLAWSFGCNDKKRALACFNGLVKRSREGAAGVPQTDSGPEEGQ